MAARSGRDHQVTDQTWMPDVVIEISSDSEADTDDEDGLDENDEPHEYLAHDTHPDDSLPSISAIAASIADARLGRTQSTNGVDNADEPDGSVNQHNRPAAVRLSSAVPSISTSSRPSPQPSIQSAPLSPSYDEVQQSQCVDISSHLDFTSTGDFLHPSRSRSLKAVPPNQCDYFHNTDTESSHLNVVCSRSVSVLGSAIRTATNMSRGPSCPEFDQGSSNHDANQQHCAVDGTNSLTSLASPTSSRPQNKERQTIFDTGRMASQCDGTNPDVQTPSHKQTGAGYGYKLRPRLVKKYLVGQGMADSEDEESAPASKRRKAAAPAPRQRLAQRGSRLPQGRRPHIMGKQERTGENSAAWPTHPAIANSEEWPLSNAVLKCVQDNGKAAFQLHFTWATSCGLHASQEQSARKLRRSTKKVQRLKLTAAKGERKLCTEGILKRTSRLDVASNDNNTCEMDCLLACWGKHTFLVKWFDGAIWWVPRRNILDKQMLREFEATYRGFDAGVDVLATRPRAKQRQCLLHWHGRPSKEDTWVNMELLSPQLVERIEESELDSNCAHT